MVHFSHHIEENRVAPKSHIPAFFRLAWKLFSVLRRRPTPHISDHLARDIGLSATELEHRRLTLPSQTSHHPRG